jgi:uncharacterized protein
MTTLEDLRRVIRRIERSHPPRPAPQSVETVLEGRVEETDHGPIVCVRREYALDHRHGRLALGPAFAAAPSLLAVLTRRGAPPAQRPRLVFLDTETTGLAGGTGTYAFLVGAGYVEDGRVVVQQFFMRDLDEEPALLAGVAALLQRFDSLVTYNGNGFDLPLLETRFVLARRRWPEHWHLDLLGPARRIFGLRCADCRLTTIESEVLGLARDHDVPGAMIPALYFDYLRRRHPGALPRIFSHNRSDILSLMTLTAWLAGALGSPEDSTLGPEEHAGLGRLWERTDPERAVECYSRALAAGLPGGLAERVRWRLAWWEKRRARWASACTLWETATRAAAFDPRPWEELAKYYEHRARDLSSARTIVNTAIDRARCERAPSAVLAALTHRLARLDRRLAGCP